jgi:uncharacterized protein GlcG (DUF336 family)
MELLFRYVNYVPETLGRRATVTAELAYIEVVGSPCSSPVRRESKIRMSMTLLLEAAEAIVSGARHAASTSKLLPLSIVVLDAGGHVLAAQREDGASNKRFEVAFGKAYGAISLGVSSRELMLRAEKQPYFIGGVTSAIGGSLVPVPGGVLIRDDRGTLIGSVGISGDTSDNDEAAAIAGIEAAGLRVG